MGNKQFAKRMNNQECGEVMIEGMIVVIITLFILIWILGLGFLYYQRYVTTIVTNDAAIKIASTYHNPTTDIIMGYTTTEDLSSRDLYRNFASSGSLSALQATNEDRASCYIKYILDKANFSGTIKDVDVKLKLVSDSTVRKHIELTSTCSFNTPFGEGLELFGMSAINTYSVTSCADCTDYADYISTVDFARALSDGRLLKGSGFIESTVKLVNSLIKVYNHAFS